MYFIITNYYLFAQASGLPQANQAGRSFINDITDTYWEQLVQGPPYASVAKIASLIGVFFIGLWAVSFFDRWQENESRPSDITALIKFALLAILLAQPAGNAPLAAKMTFQLHQAVQNTITQFNDDLVKGLVCAAGTTSCSPDGTLTARAIAKTEAINTANFAAQNCFQQESEEEQNACFADAKVQVQQILSPFSGDSFFGEQWAQELDNQLTQELEDTAGPGIASFSVFSDRLIDSVVNPLIQGIISTYLIGFGASVKFGISLVEVIFAFVGPFALSLSLADVGKLAPLKGWFSAFLGLGIVELTLVGIIHLTSYTFILSNDNGFLLLYPIVFGIIGPLIALGVGGLSMVAIFLGLSKVSSSFAR